MTRIKGLLLGLGIGISLAIALLVQWLIGAFIVISNTTFLLIFIIVFSPLFIAIIGYVLGGIIQDKRRKIGEEKPTETALEE